MTGDHCPLCSQDTEFLPFGLAHRPRAMCGRCGSLERHRMLGLHLDRSDLPRPGGARVLHVAPEEPLTRRLSADPAVEYLSIDLSSPQAMRHMDLTALDLDDDSFDLIVCAHVLEHIPDDGAAMGELHRVLAPGGTLIAQVPFNAHGPTDEDLTVTDPAERERRWGQHDHVRTYGVDFVDRLRQAGFEVEAVTIEELVDDGQRQRMAINPGEVLHVCRPAVPVSVPPVSVGETRSRSAVVVLTESPGPLTELAVRRASAIGEVVVLDRSGVAGPAVGAEVAEVDWEDDRAVRRALDDRGIGTALITTDLEELVVFDAAAVRNRLEAGGPALVESPEGSELRVLPVGETLSFAGAGPAPVLDDVIVRPHLGAAPRATVIIPTFNRPGVRVAVRDVLLQRGTTAEIVVVNDAGLDPRPALGEALGIDGLTVVDAVRNRGLGAARNLGMEHARGDVVLFLDDDDRIGASHVADLDAGMQRAGTDMVTGGAVMVHTDDTGVEVARYRRMTPQFDRSTLEVRNFIVVHTALTRLDRALDVGGFDDELGVLEDWEFWIRFTARWSAATVPVWSAEYHLSERLGANVINSSAGAQLATLQAIYAKHPVTSAAIAAERAAALQAHEAELARVGYAWPVTVGVLGHPDPWRTAQAVEHLRGRHPVAEAQVIVHQPRHVDAEAALSPLLGRATICLHDDADPAELRHRIGIQALGAQTEIVELDRTSVLAP